MWLQGTTRRRIMRADRSPSSNEQAGAVRAPQVEQSSDTNAAHDRSRCMVRRLGDLLGERATRSSRIVRPRRPEPKSGARHLVLLRARDARLWRFFGSRRRLGTLVKEEVAGGDQAFLRRPGSRRTRRLPGAAGVWSAGQQQWPRSVCAAGSGLWQRGSRRRMGHRGDRRRPRWPENGGRLPEVHAARGQPRRGLTCRPVSLGSMPWALGEHGFT